MQPQSTTYPSIHYATLPITNGRVTLDGFGIRLSIQRGHLQLEDGIGDERRRATFHRATCGLKHVAIIGHTGSISLDVLRWLTDVGASLSIIDKDGVVLLSHGPRGRDDGRLRRAQAIAPYTGTHLPIIRFLLRRKLEGQRENLTRFMPGHPAPVTIDAMLHALDHVDSSEPLRVCEAQAANAYWDALADVPMTFGKHDVVPSHWTTFGGRASALTSNPRRATNPINALLNYTYATLEAEASIALMTVGLDPALGVLHADMANRDSLSCDVMEAIRPEVDSFVLGTLKVRTFQAREFYETREGVCRVMPPLTTLLSTTGSTWARLLAPIVEQVAQMFMDVRLPIEAPMSTFTLHQARGADTARVGQRTRKPAPKQQTLPTILTQSRRSAGRDGIRTRPATPASTPKATLPPTCTRCGGPVTVPDRLYCDECFLAVQQEQMRTLQQNGPRALAGTNHGGDVAAKRGRAIASRHQAIRDWEREHGTDYDPADFTMRILPAIQVCPLSVLVKATGLSLRYVSLVRRGERVPHPLQWGAFARAGKGVAV